MQNERERAYCDYLRRAGGDVLDDDVLALEGDLTYMKVWAEQLAAGKRQGEVDPVRSTPGVPDALGLYASGA